MKPFYRLAGAVALVVVGHELTAMRPFHAAIIEIGIVLSLPLGFLYTGFRTARLGFDRGATLRVFLGTLLFGTIALAIAALLVVISLSGGASIEDQVFVLILAWTVGARMGPH